MTVVTVINRAQDELGLTRSSQVFSAQDDATRRMTSLLRATGDELVRRYDWQSLVTERVFTAVATEEQPGAIPVDLKSFINQTLYNRSEFGMVLGPEQPTDYQRIKAGPATVVWDTFRIRDNKLYVLPVPSAGTIFAFEYVSSRWIKQGETNIDDINSDENTFRLSEDLLRMGVIWRWLRAQGLQFAAQQEEYEIAVADAIARDGSKPVLDFAGWSNTTLGINVSDGNWDLT